MLAFATDFSGESTKITELEATLKKIAEAGFTHVHWCHEWDGDYSYSIYEMVQIRQWLDQYGLKAKSLHATKGTRKPCGDSFSGWFRRDFTSEHELNRLAGVELIRNRIDLACTLGATEVVLHMLLPYLTFEKDPSFEQHYYEQTCKSFDELEYYCKARGVRLCIENMLDTPIEHQIKQFDTLFARYSPDWMGICIDTGHALISNASRMLELPRRYQDRIFCVHLNDNQGIPSDSYYRQEALMCSCDLHLPPYDGQFDWDGFLKILAASPYQLPLLLELCCHEENELEFLRKSYLVGEKLTSLFHQYRHEK